jgi:cell shape-determining protein MreD
MKIGLGVIAVVIVAWLQVSFFGHVRPLGVMPNLMLAAVVAFGLWSNATPALAAAIGGGLLLDLASGSDFGLRMAFYLVMVLALVAARQLGVQADALVTAVMAVVIGGILYNAVVLATLGASPSWLIAGRVGRELVDDLVVMLLIFLVRLNVGRRGRAGGGLGRELPS